MLTALLLTLVSAPNPCTEVDRAGYCRAKVANIPIRYQSGGARIKANIELGKVLTVTFPDSVQLRSDPVVGNALFRVEAQRLPALQLAIWPELPPQVEESEMFGLKTNVQVFLDSDLLVLIELRVAKPGRGMDAVQLSFPERAEKESEYVRERVRELEASREEKLRERLAGLDAEVAARAELKLARALLRHKHCEPLVRTRAQTELLIVWVEELCRIGDGMLFARFYLKNRRRGLFTLGEVSVSESGSETAVGVEGVQVVWEKDGRPVSPENVHLPFGERVEGMAVIPVDAESGAARVYALTVQEAGGRMRTVSVDVSF